MYRYDNRKLPEGGIVAYRTELIESVDLEAMSRTIASLSSRASVRQYSERNVTDDTIRMILNAARQAPTSSNLQAYSFVVIRDLEKRRLLSQIAGNQSHIVTAPVLVAICADLNRLTRVCQHRKQPATISGVEIMLVSVIDAALVGMGACLSAESLGLGTVMIGALRNEPEKVAELLNLPHGVFVTFGLCIGWPAYLPPPKPRLPENVVIHWERYEPAVMGHSVRQYDRQLSEYYREIGANGWAWSARIAHHLSYEHRTHMRDSLANLGFNISDRG